MLRDNTGELINPKIEVVMSGDFWTQEELDILVKMHGAGHNSHAVKKVLKSRTHDSIRHQADRLGLVWKWVTPDIDYDLLKTLLPDEGVTDV